MQPHIGIFDSGIGGLTVLNQVRDHLPHARFTYIADQAFAPYGSLPEVMICQRSKLAVKWLLLKKVDLVIVACNTATASCIDILRETYPSNFIVGTEPPIKYALNDQTANSILILATQVTLASKRLASLVQKHARSHKIYSNPCLGLVELIEAGHTSDSEVLHKYFSNLTTQYQHLAVSHVVLGCTHYPLIKPLIQKKFPKSKIIDPNLGISKHVASLLSTTTNNKNLFPIINAVTTSKANQFSRLLKTYFPHINAITDSITLD